MNYEKILSNCVQNMKPSGIRRFFDLAATLDDVISLHHRLVVELCPLQALAADCPLLVVF